MTCLGREGPRTRVLDIPKDACPQARSKAPRWRPGKSALCACRGRAEAEAGRRGGHEAHSSGVGIPGEGPGPPRPLSSLKRKHCKALRTAHRRFPQAALRQNRGSSEALLVPAEGSLAHRSSSDGAGRGAEDAGPGAPRRRGRRGWEGAGREVVPGARPRMLAAPAAAAAAAALGAAPGLGRSLRAPLGPFAGDGDARTGRGLGRAVPACAA